MKTKMFCSLAVASCLAACGGGSSSSTSASDSTTSTAGVLCTTSGSGSTVIGVATNTSANYSYSWSCGSSTRSLTANGIPNHTVGTFPNVNNPNTISAQSVSFSAKLATSLNSSANYAVSVIGYGLNGVKFDPNTGGGCPDSASATSSCTLIGGGTWSLEALVSNTPFNFGADSNNAHVQPTGEYHYHGAPTGLYTALGGSGTSMKLIGWAADGFPIYYKYGYTSAMDATSALKNLVGNYRANSSSTTLATRPSSTVFPLGTFKNDWAYSASNGGDLDECNGRTGVTPEFPNGIYYYVATDSYPYVQRCLKGSTS
jgi:hypothetical protein